MEMINSTQHAEEALGSQITFVQAEDGTVYVPLKRLCESLGIDYEGQRSKVRNSEELNAELISVPGPDGRRRKMLCLPVDAVGEWASTIDPDTIRPEVLKALEGYQDDEIDKGADSEEIAPRRESMEQIKSQIDFLQWLYLLKGTVKSIGEHAESWMKENEGAIPFRHRLMRSPLALRTVRDLIYWMWDIGETLEGYVDDSHREAFRSLQALYIKNVEERRQDEGLDIVEPEYRARDLEALNQAARTLYEIVDDAFEESFLELPWPGDEWALDKITRELRLINGKLEDKLFWLGNILDDLGKVMTSDGISLATKTPRDQRTTSIKREHKRIRARA